MTTHLAPAPGHLEGIEETTTPELARHLLAYRQWLRITKRRDPKTVLHYLNTARPFCDDWNRPLAEATTVEIEKWMADWQLSFESRNGHLPSIESVRGLHKGLVSFFGYLERMGEPKDADGRELANPMRRIDAPSAPPGEIDFLSPEEDDALLAACENDIERICIYLLRFTGLRSFEAVGLTQRMVSTETILYNGPAKGGSQTARREIPVFPILAPVLAQWFSHLEGRGLRDDKLPLLYGAKGEPLRRAGLRYYLKRVADRAGIRPYDGGVPGLQSLVTPHTLRRTFATALLNTDGIDPSIVSKLLGHSSTAVTEQRYAAFLPETMRRRLREALG